MEHEREAQSNNEWSFDDDFFCDEICSDDNYHTSNVSSDVIARSAHDEPDRHNRLCESITVIAEVGDRGNDGSDFNKTSSECSTVVVRRDDTPDNEDHVDFSSLAESEGVQSQSSDEKKVQTVPKECTKVIKVVAKSLGLTGARSTTIVKIVPKKKT